jgi:hypothetical protein
MTRRVLRLQAGDRAVMGWRAMAGQSASRQTMRGRVLRLAACARAHAPLLLGAQLG